MSFHPLRSTEITKMARNPPYKAPVDQYLSHHKNYVNRGAIVEKTFNNFDGFSFSRTLPLEEYLRPEYMPAHRTQLGTGASPGTGDRPVGFLYGSPQPF